MFKKKLQALGFHTPDQNVEDEKNFRNLVCWLEDQKINHYMPEQRKALRNTSSNDWLQEFNKYLEALSCPHLGSDCRLCINWLLSHAVQLEYQRKASQVKLPQNSNASNPLEALDFSSPDFKKGVQLLASTIQMPSHDDPAILLKAISMVIEKNLTKNAIEASAKAKSLPSIPLNQIDLGFETKDLISDDVGRILRLCYLHELRELQDVANQAIVASQTITANPKTDTKLGKVGRG